MHFDVVRLRDSVDMCQILDRPVHCIVKNIVNHNVFTTIMFLLPSDNGYSLCNVCSVSTMLTLRINASNGQYLRKNRHFLTAACVCYKVQFIFYANIWDRVF